MFCEPFTDRAFGFPYILFFTFFTFNHTCKVSKITGYMLFYLSCFAGVAKSVRSSCIVNVRASETSMSGVAAESASGEHNHDKDKSNSPVPFTITYNPALPNIQEIRHRKQPILNSTDRLQKIFKDKPFIAYRRSPNLRDLLVRAKLDSYSMKCYRGFFYVLLHLMLDLSFLLS